MRRTKLAALTLAGVMTLGTATPAFAAAEGTPVGFTIEPPCVEYSMTIPTGNTSVATNGDFSSIGNLTVVKKDKDFDAKHKLEVTVSRGTEMVKAEATSSATTAITYDLYTGDAKVDDNKVADGDKIEFSAEDINAASGKSVAMGVALSGTNFDSLVPGDYRDTITFAAEAVVAKAATTLSKDEVKAKVDAVADKLLCSDYYTPPRLMSNVWTSFSNQVWGYAFTVNNDGTYTFETATEESTDTIVVTITDGEVVSVVRSWDGRKQTFLSTGSSSSSSKVTIEGVEIVAKDGESWSTIVSNNEGLLKTERDPYDGIEYVKINVDGYWEDIWTDNGSTQVKPSDTFSAEKTYRIPV